MAARGDANADVVATVAFAYGQLKDADAVGWLGDEMSGPAVPAAVAREAARSLGKIRSPEARAALVRYLGEAPMTAATLSVAGEALLSLGRFAAPIDLAAVVRWTHSTDIEVRWRAAWALYRPRDLAAVPELLRLSRDASGDVRLWACRGLGVPPPPAPASGRGPAATPAPAAIPPSAQLSEPARAQASSRLREALTDSDRRVRTEALCVRSRRTTTTRLLERCWRLWIRLTPGSRCPRLRRLPGFPPELLRPSRDSCAHPPLVDRRRFESRRSRRSRFSPRTPRSIWPPRSFTIRASWLERRPFKRSGASAPTAARALTPRSRPTRTFRIS